MKVDISRDTFAPVLHFSRVLLQQGRVQLDADFNEQMAILLHYGRTVAADLIGPHGGPSDDLGFALYNATTLSTAPGAPGNLPAGFDVHNFIIGPGRYYVAGLLVECEDFLLFRRAEKHDPAHPLPISVQPVRPDGPALKPKTNYVAYLDVWERLVTVIQDDAIREAALNGADTAARAQVAFAVRVVALGVEVKLPDVVKNLRSNPEQLLDLIGQKPPAKGAMLRARVDPGDTSIADEVCTLPPDSQYRGDENQLYRVEIHTGGSAEEATFVWARDNASVVFPVVSANGALVTVEHLGRDLLHGLEIGDWVELVDDDTPAPGVGDLYQVHDVDPVGLTVTLQQKGGAAAKLHTDAARHPFLRRWDYTDPAPDDAVGTGADPAEPADDGALKVRESSDPDSGWIDLEDGVQIQFPATEGTAYLPGDYWLIPARTATGNIEWPSQAGNGPHGQKSPQSVPARHVEHGWAPLWVFSLDDHGIVATDASLLFDLRRRFEPLAKPVT